MANDNRSRNRTPAKRGAKGGKRGAKTKPKRSLLRRLLRVALVLMVLGVLAAAGGAAALLSMYGRELPDIENVRDYQPKQVSRVLAADGSVLATLADEDAEYRTVVAFDEIPQVMRDAMVAAEDSDFYNHPGLDYVGLARAVITNLRRGELSQGASTITQQVVKNLVLSPERTIRRKVQEALLAFRLEDRLTKDEILTIYLNEVFFGSRYYGVEEASRYYFGHGAAELELGEAALLAGLVQSPNRYNPHFHPEEALARRSYVLRQMWEKGYIEEAVYRQADEAPLELDPRQGRATYEGRFGWYVDAVRRALLERFDEALVYTGGLRVETAMDVALQATAEEAVRSGLRDFDGRHGFHTPFRTLDSPEAVAAWRAEHHGDVASLGLRPGHEYRAVILAHEEARSVVAIGPYVATLRRSPESRLRPDERTWDELFPPNTVFTVTPAENWGPEELSETDPDGIIVDLLPSAQASLVSIEPDTRRVVALVGGYDFDISPFNRAVQSQRQVGSAFKPIVYGAALRARVTTPGTIFLDQPVTFPMDGGRTWQPRNYDGEFRGPMSLRAALAASRNVIAVRVLDLVGLDAAGAFARDLGVSSELTDNLTLALGSAELSNLEATNAIATLAAGGLRGEPVFIERVTNTRGEVLYTADGVLEQTVDPAVAWLTTSLMRSVVEGGTGSRARAVGHPVVGKTGTTNGARDAWFLGFSRHLVTGVWVGRDNNETLGRGESGGRSALPIWTDFMTTAHEGREVLEFERPQTGITSVTIDADTGLLARPGTTGVTEYYLTGTEPTEFAPDVSDRAIDDVLLGGGSAPPPTGAGTPAPSEDGF